MEGFADQTQSQYHGGFFYIERIHHILQALNTCTATRNSDAEHMTKNLRHNYNLLNDLFKELCGKMDLNIKKEHQEASKILKQKLESAIIQYNKTRKLPMTLENQLDCWELELRTFAEKKGLLVPDKMSPGDAIGW